MFAQSINLPKVIALFLLITGLLVGVTACTAEGSSPDQSSAELDEDDADGEGYGEGALLLPMSVINITLLAIAMVIITTSIIDYGSSTVGGAWAYFLIGTALLGATRLFYILADRGVLFIADDTLEFWWHLIFYLSLITYYLGARGLVRMVTMNEAWTSFSEVVAWGIFSTLFTVGVFFSAEPLDGPFVSVFSGTFLARIGIQHWIAFALGTLVTIYVLRIRVKLGRSVSIIANPLLFALALLALYHFWELLTESLEIIVLDERTIERAEQFITTPIAVAIIYGFYRSRVAMFGRGMVPQSASMAQPGQV